MSFGDEGTVWETERLVDGRKELGGAEGWSESEIRRAMRDETTRGVAYPVSDSELEGLRGREPGSSRLDLLIVPSTCSNDSSKLG